MADNLPQPDNDAGADTLVQTDKRTGQSTVQTIPIRRITKEEFGLAPALGEDNEAYAASYNTD